MKHQIVSASLKAASLLILAGFNLLTIHAQTPGNAPVASTSTNWETIKQGRHLTVRINRDADMSRYEGISVGDIDYTGPSKKLNTRDSGKLTSLVRDSLTKDLASASQGRDNSTAPTLTLNANITSVRRSHPLINLITIAAVFVPLDLGGAKMTASVVDKGTGQTVAEIDTVGCGKIYQVLGSLQALGQSKIVLAKESRSIVREVTRMYSRPQPHDASVATLAEGR